jgi:NTP pyrophosphatase (non-canonical NTP hydrolase)
MSDRYGSYACDDVLDELHRGVELQKAGRFAKVIGVQTDFEALSTLTEEVGEVAHEVNETIGRSDTDVEAYEARLRAELVQVAAMAVGWILKLDGHPYK